MSCSRTPTAPTAPAPSTDLIGEVTGEVEDAIRHAPDHGDEDPTWFLAGQIVRELIASGRIVLNDAATVEKAATAIATCQENEAFDDPTDSYWHSAREDYRKDARAALTAITTPTIPTEENDRG